MPMFSDLQLHHSKGAQWEPQQQSSSQLATIVSRRLIMSLTMRANAVDDALVDLHDEHAQF